jgi:hypothetical protein
VLLCFAHCWRAAETEIALLEWKRPRRILIGLSRKEEVCSMRVHLDRKYLDGLDGNVVAFVVLSLIIIIAFVY